MNEAEGRRERMAAATAAAWVEARPRIMDRLAVLQAAAAAGDDLDTALRRDAEGEAHKLAGSLGMFGFPAGSELAHELEEMLQGDAPIGPDFAGLVSRLAGGLPPP